MVELMIVLIYFSYSFENDHKYQRESQQEYYNSRKKIFSIYNLKKILKKLIPQKIISFRQDFIKMKNIRKDLKLNWFINNTGDNCYIRGILKKR